MSEEMNENKPEMEKQALFNETDEVMAQKQAKSDAQCKAILSDKLVLACILKSCADEFKDCHVHDIETKYIEGEPVVMGIGIHPDTSNSPEAFSPKIHGLNTEDTLKTESCVRFDIRFYVVTPTKERIRMIVNVESQNDYYPGYPMIKRGVYYAARQISSQYGVEFDKSHYEKIKKVYSIWICFDSPKYRHNTINKYQLKEENVIGDVKEAVALYDLICIVMICLGNNDENNYNGILKFLDVFMSGNATVEQKNDVLKSEYHTELPERFRTQEDDMFDFGLYRERKGEQKGEIRGEIRGEIKGRFASLLALMNNLKLSLDDAMTALSVPDDEKPKYREMLETAKNSHI